MTSSTKNYPGESEVELQLSDSPSDAAAFPHPKGHRGVRMVGLVFVKPPTGLKFIWVWKHCRIPWRSIVAQGNQRLDGNSFAITRETHVQAICDEASQPVHVQTHLLGDEVSSHLDVLLRNDPSIGRNNGVQPGQWRKGGRNGKMFSFISFI